MAKVCTVVLLILGCSASLRGVRASSGFTHPYLLQLYNQTTDQFGRVRNGVQLEDVIVWGLLDDGKDGLQSYDNCITIYGLFSYAFVYRYRCR